MLRWFKEKIFLKMKTRNAEQCADIPGTTSRKNSLSPMIAERVIAESEAEREAKKAIQKGIDMEWKLKSDPVLKCDQERKCDKSSRNDQNEKCDRNFKYEI